MPYKLNPRYSEIRNECDEIIGFGSESFFNQVRGKILMGGLGGKPTGSILDDDSQSILDKLRSAYKEDEINECEYTFLKCRYLLD